MQQQLPCENQGLLFWSTLQLQQHSKCKWARKNVKEQKVNTSETTGECWTSVSTIGKSKTIIATYMHQRFCKYTDIGNAFGLKTHLLLPEIPPSGPNETVPQE